MSRSGSDRLAALIALGFALALLVCVVGCAPTTGTGDGMTPTAEGPTENARSDTGSVETTMGGVFLVTKVYFSQGTDGGEKLVGIGRQLPQGWSVERKLRLALNEWLDGPTRAEADQGLWLAAAEGTRLLDVRVDDGMATVDLSGAFEPKGGAAATMNSLGQMIYTATDVPGISSVRVKVDGKAIDQFGGEGFDTSKPLTRADVAGYFSR